ncbi:MAG: DUF4252 domain-containing protein [bacterium]|nr:DUF4252 domain-containing protein [bacterium]
MKKNLETSAILGCALLAALLLTGCKETPSASAVKWELERQVPGLSLERESHVRLGRFTMGLAKGILRMLPDEDEEDLRIISHVRRVDVATYRVVERPEGEIDIPIRFEQRLADNGWETLARVREDDEQTWVLYHLDDSGKGSIDAMFVVTLDRWELAVVALEGRLDKVIAEAVADDPEDLVEIFG